MALVRDMRRRDILQVYLSGLWLGHGAYGVGAGALAWFHHPLKDITLSEAAFMAGLARGPAIMEPQTHPERARARRAYVLDRMAAGGYIPKDQAAMAQAAPPPHPDPISNTGIGQSFYSDTVRGIILGEEGVRGVPSLIHH